MNAADTSWMLISTALVLLMTPALAFFYGGLVRSKNALNTMMMSFISLGFVGVLWALDRLFAGAHDRQQLDWRHCRSRCLRGVGLGVEGTIVPVTIPHVLYMCLPGHVLHHHRGAHLRRHRRADALLGLRRLHHALGARRLQLRSRTGCGAAAGWPTWARSTSPAAPSST